MTTEATTDVDLFVSILELPAASAGIGQIDKFKIVLKPDGRHVTALSPEGGDLHVDVTTTVPHNVRYHFHLTAAPLGSGLKFLDQKGFTYEPDTECVKFKLHSSSDVLLGVHQHLTPAKHFTEGKYSLFFEDANQARYEIDPGIKTTINGH